MISVDEARTRLLALAGPLDAERVTLEHACGRVLAEPITATRDQPPFESSAMDGYAVHEAAVGQVLRVIGASQAGARFAGVVGPGEAVRLFTGAPIPQGASRVVLQEDVTREGDSITIGKDLGAKPHIRPRGSDFTAGFTLEAGTQVTPARIALLAAMNITALSVTRRADLALLPTGNEIIAPGGTPGPDQIISSNGHGLRALLDGPRAGCRLFPPIPDEKPALDAALDRAADADLIVTIGGASVGEHDLVADAVARLGGTLDFHRIAMRPGKPLMAGRIGRALFVGLPGNPISAMVTAHLFLRPLLDVMAGLPANPPRSLPVRLGAPIGPNGEREHYIRARWEDSSVRALGSQDSSLLSVLADANALIRRPIHDPARAAGDMVEVFPLTDA